ncbi:superoxide dismutase [Niallia sp. Krafla_26]|uniref:superoxide dismutase n=1 Tax=Niallia sp. Krafla_26 TaxID=3064703 RepID=UPI003D18347A
MTANQKYLNHVVKWNEEVIDFLKAEKVEEDENIYLRVHDFSEQLLKVTDEDVTTAELSVIEKEAVELHHEIQEYFKNRQSNGTIFLNETYIGAGKHQLPPLPYEYNALEPYISEEIMKLHHQKHHQSYVDGLNKAETNLEMARKAGDFSLVKHWSRELAFHGSGHYLHTIFWNNMRPNGGGQPSRILLREMDKYFGSFEAFKKHFSEAAKAVEGVGWAILVWSPRSRHLEILQSERHMLLTQWDTIPLLALDVWEHAYYLQYKNNRAQYVDNWWNLVNWKDVEERFLKARQIKWKPF